MNPADLDSLIEMGFDKVLATAALKKKGNLDGALEWIEANQDRDPAELEAEAAEEEEKAGPSVAPVEGEAKSLVCNECGKKFKNQALAEYHASKTDHTDFSESIEEIAPLTEEQKKAKLEELRQKLAAKRANKTVEELEQAKRNERIRQKSTKETQDLKEDLARKEQIKEAAKKRQEKQEEMDAKKRVLAKIAEDKAERARKAAGGQGSSLQSAPPPPAAAQPPPVAAPKPAVDHNEANLRFRTKLNGMLQKTFPADTTLQEVADFLRDEHGVAVKSLGTTFPTKNFGEHEFGQTLKEVGWVPNAVVIVK